MSWRLAPSIVTPIGLPCPSVSRLRFAPSLPRSVGFRPVFFPPKRGVGHHSIHTQPRPVAALQFVELFDARPPELEKDTRLNPLREAVRGGGLGAYLGFL